MGRPRKNDQNNSNNKMAPLTDAEREELNELRKQGLTEKEKEDYKKRNKDAILNHVIPAYNHLAEFLKGLKGTGKTY